MGSIMSTSSTERPILVPVDFSRHSLTALEWAADLARRISAPMVVLHVVHDPENAPGYYRRPDQDETWTAEASAREMLDRFVADARKEVGDLGPLTTDLVVGVPVQRILEVAERIDALQIVMGSHGRTGLPHLLLGSKAQSVVQLAPIPVTIVKAENGSLESDASQSEASE